MTYPAGSSGVTEEPSIARLYSYWLNRVGIYGRLSPWEITVAVLPTSTYPGGSRTRVNRAGANIRNGTQSADNLAVVDLWRAAHRAVLNIPSDLAIPDSRFEYRSCPAA